MIEAPFENALMLVAILPSVKDLEIARLLGWYRIPMRMAPKIVDVDYLAFYQTNAFGKDHHWQIEHFAEVKGHELTTRKELLRDEPDHPRANEEYYKIELGNIFRRPEPIPAENWKRITFFYTLGHLFNQAKTINDLVVHSDERELLWQGLRERAQFKSLYQVNNSAEDREVDPQIMELLFSFINPPFDENFEK